MQTRYEAPRRRSAYRGREKSSGGTLTAVRMVACALVLGVVVLLKAFFPDTAQTAREFLLPMMEEDMDYQGAITAIGETLTGETKITEVLGDLYVLAFGGVTEPEVEASVETAQPTETPAPAVTNTPIEQVIVTPTALPVTPEPVEEEPEEDEAGAEVEETEDAVAVFLASQEPFSDYELPASVTYDYVTFAHEYTLPVSGPVSSTFGYRDHPLDEGVKFHYGTDIAVDTGTPIAAFSSGTVTEAAESEGWGLYMVIDHGDGLTTRYAHCNALYVQAGDTVELGQTIGEVGATGNVTGPHLHFELRVDGMYLNPEYYLTFA